MTLGRRDDWEVPRSARLGNVRKSSVLGGPFPIGHASSSTHSHISSSPFVNVGVSVEATVSLITIVSMEAPISPVAQTQLVCLFLETGSAGIGRSALRLYLRNRMLAVVLASFSIQHKGTSEGLFFGVIQDEPPSSIRTATSERGRLPRYQANVP